MFFNRDLSMWLIIWFLPILLLSGCADEPAKNSVDTITPAEAEALNDAAAMLDQTEPPPRLTNDTGQATAPPVPAE